MASTSSCWNSPDLEDCLKILLLKGDQTDEQTVALAGLHLATTKIARQFALLHNALKFELMHLLSDILSTSKDSAAPVREALRLMPNKDWAAYVRLGVIDVLQNHVAPVEKMHALALAESVISIVGEGWLIDYQTNLVDESTKSIPVDRCLWLVLETSRVEIVVLLNDIAYLNYEAALDDKSSDQVALKQQDLGVAFSLIEKIIKLISKDCGGAESGSEISEGTLMKVIAGITETIGVVLEYLQDAKDHGKTKGDDILASVRVVGSFLAEAPFACKEKVRDLLEYMLSIKSEDEPSPFYSVCFLLPMMCQMTMETEGCITLASFGGHKSVMECLVRIIGGLNKSPQVEDTDGAIYLACDTIMNFLLKIEDIDPAQVDGSSSFIHLLRALTYWAEVDANNQSVIMMASSISSLIFDFTSEEALLSLPNFELSTLNGLSWLVARSLVTGGKDMSDVDPQGDVDLHQIVSTGYARWRDRFPHIQQAVQFMNH